MVRTGHGTSDWFHMQSTSTKMPLVVKELKETVDNMRYLDRVIAITSQSAEFLDCLLQSELDFALVTVRKDTKEEDLYRLRVISKEEAWANRCAFRFELRR